MTEKEFRKLKTLDLIQILLAQSSEEAKLEEELEKQKEHLVKLHEHNDGLKAELNDKDALIETLKQDLNQSDADIQNLRTELKELYTDKRINLENIGSLTEVAQKINHIFEAAQREADEYLARHEHVYVISQDSESEEAVVHHALLAVDSAGRNDIEPETERSGSGAENTEPQETAVFEDKNGHAEDAAGESLDSQREKTASEVKDNADEHIAADSADGSTVKEPDAKAADMKQEPPQYKVTVKKAWPNKNWLKKFLGRVKRNKAG